MVKRLVIKALILKIAAMIFKEPNNMIILFDRIEAVSLCSGRAKSQHIQQAENHCIWQIGLSKERRSKPTQDAIAIPCRL